MTALWERLAETAPRLEVHDGVLYEVVKRGLAADDRVARRNVNDYPSIVAARTRRITHGLDELTATLIDEPMKRLHTEARRIHGMLPVPPAGREWVSELVVETTDDSVTAQLVYRLREDG